MTGFFSRLLQSAFPADGARVTGAPTSSNRASSFHLNWEIPRTPLSEVRATIEVIEPPTVSMLYFWALQVSFVGPGGRIGGAHIGLQHHPSYPDACAVNWGGYRDGQGELKGSVSALPSALNNINTRTCRWYPNRQYVLRVYRSPDQGWRGSVTDTSTGEETVIRDLWVDADHLASPVVWSEVFAHCDHASAAVRWSGLTGIGLDGIVHDVRSVRLNYQTHQDGGCANTDSSVDEVGFVQRTAVERQSQTGQILTLPN